MVHLLQPVQVFNNRVAYKLVLLVVELNVLEVVVDKLIDAVEVVISLQELLG